MVEKGASVEDGLTPFGRARNPERSRVTFCQSMHFMREVRASQRGHKVAGFSLPGWRFGPTNARSWSGCAATEVALSGYLL